MAVDAIQRWVRARRKAGIWDAAAYATLTLLGGILLSALTAWVLFMAVKLILLTLAPGASWITACAVLVTALMGILIFLDSMRWDRDDMSTFSLWLLREYIGIGPRLLLEGFPYVRKVGRWRRIPVENCARVLEFLAARDGAVTRIELQRRFPELDWTVLEPFLRLFVGVIFFRPDGARLTLALPLRLELRALRRMRRVHVKGSASAEEPSQEPVSNQPPETLSPAEILGVAANASVQEIRVAYRKRIKECHPDKFAAMDESSRQLAEEWTKSLNAAYESLLAGRRSG